MTSATSVQNGSSARGARRRPPAPRPTPPERRRGRAIAAARRSATRSAAVALALCMVWSVVMDERVSAACWREPVIGVVVDPFRPPPCPWCAGNRGLEYRTAPGGRVRSVAAGTVAFSGAVAGTRYVVVTLASGWKVTYGRLAGTAVARGDRVVAGAVVGTVGRAFFFGLRVGGSYVDPAPHLGRLVGRPRLIPLDGGPPRPAPPPMLRCRE